MRKDEPELRAAEYSWTGTLTNPNVSVPDQNGRGPVRPPSPSPPPERASELERPRSSGTLPRPRRLQAGRERLLERRALVPALAVLAELDGLAFRLRLDQLHDPVPPRVLPLLRLERALEHLHEPLRHLPLPRLELARRGRYDLRGAPEGDQHRHPVVEAERPPVTLLPHGPADDPHQPRLVEGRRQGVPRDLGRVAVGPEEIGPVVPQVRQLRGIDESEDLDVARPLGLELGHILLREDDHAAVAGFVAPKRVRVRHLVAGFRIHHPLLHRNAILPVEEPEVDAAVLYPRVDLQRHPL